MLRPAAQQRLQYASGGTFPYGHAAGNADDIRDTLPVSTQELLQYGLTAQVRANIEIE